MVELVRGTRATGSLFELVARNRRRYGGYVVHAAIVLLAIGIAGSSAYGTVREQKLAAGPVDDRRRPHRHLQRPRARATSGDAERDARGADALAAASTARFGAASTTTSPGDTSREVGIHTNWLRAEDTYVIFDQQQAASTSSSRCSSSRS